MNVRNRELGRPASKAPSAISIDDLIGDERLGRLFSGADLHCALQLWILQIRHSDSVESRVLYGRLLPYTYSNAKWSASDRDKFQSLAGVHAQVIRLNLYVQSSTCAELLRLLASGKAIDSISETLELDLSPELAARIGSVSLGHQALVYRPVAFLPNRDSHMRGTLSPHGHAGALSASITSTDKTSLFLVDGEYVPELIALAVSRMSEDTGLDFARSDKVRFGDLELLTFPALSDQERSLLDVQWVDERRGLAVRFDPVQLREVATVRFRVSLEDAGNVMHAATAKACLDNEGKYSHTFAITNYLSEQNDTADVEVYWAKSEQPDEEVLCCRWRCSFVREIALRGSMVGPRTSVIKSDWLQKTVQRDDLKARADSVMTVNRRTPTFNDAVGGRNADPWVSINREVSELFSSLFPAASKGGFFERSGIGDKAGRLEFAEWFKKLLAKYSDHQVVIFDPFFDTAGLDLILVSASGASDYLVFTSLPKQKKQAERGEGVMEEPAADMANEAEEAGDDEAHDSYASDSDAPTRVQNLATSCEGSRELIADVKLRIFGMAAKRLHDRYILVAGHDGIPVAGFNLSNSLQAAAQNHPLLVTPIPADLLPKVDQYKQGLVREALAASQSQPQNSSMRLIFESGPTPAVAAASYDPLQILGHERAGDVIGAWTGNPSLSGLSGDQLIGRMKDAALILDGRIQLPDSAGMIRCVDALGGDYSGFSGTWEVLAWLIAHSPAGDEELPEIGQHPGLFQFLVGHLQSAVLLDPESMESEIASTDASLIPQSLGNLLRTPYRAGELVHYTRLRPLGWAEYYALKLLWAHDAEALLTLFEGWLEHLKQPSSATGAVRTAAMNQAVSNISWSVQLGLNDAHRQKLLASQVGFLRWMGVAGLFKLLKKPDGLQQMLRELAVLTHLEKVQVLGAFIQWSSAGRDGEVPRAGLIDALHGLLPAMITANDLRTVVDSMRGHMGSLAWAEPWLFDDVVLPLLQKERAKYDDAAGIWQKEVKSMLDPLRSGASRLFDASREGRTLNVLAFLLANSEAKTQASILKDMERALGRCRRVIQQPLASTSSWSAWDDAITVSMWLLAFCKCAELYQTRGGSVSSDLTELSGQAELLMGPRPELERRAESGVGRRELLDFIGHAERSLASECGV